jgi:pilus assembly protein Flp/PilA
MPRHAAKRPIRNAIWHRFFADDTGVTAIEYGLITALISLTIIGAVSTAGQAIKTVLYQQIINALAALSG